MFRRLPETGMGNLPGVPVTLDGRPFLARAGDSVAAVLLLAGCVDTRITPVSGTHRGPFCMMGACFDCVVTIDGQANRQACLVTVAPGMRIDTTGSAR